MFRLALAGVAFAATAALAQTTRPAGPLVETFCNPLAIPDYPRGNWTRKPSPNLDRFLKGFYHDFRELADPSVVYDNGRWILYPSCQMAYVSDDFRTWRSVPIDPPRIGDGYAPTVVRHGDKWLMTGCFAGLWQADDPLGPFKELGPITTPAGVSTSEKIFDPALFVDDDGRLYLYYMTSGACVGAELDPKSPTKMLAEPKKLFGSRAKTEEWERYGEYNEDTGRSFFEGPWMFKHRGVYHLTFTAPGTANGTYALGSYRATSPLGEFEYQKNNPILRKTSGVIPGSGHGSIVRGPGDTLWAFTTGVQGIYHVFERRLSLFPVGIDANGDVFGLAQRDVPQFAPGAKTSPERGNEAGWLPVSVRTIASASSVAPGQTADYAMDDSCRTWWQPAAADQSPSLTIDLKTVYDVAAVRVMWAEPGLDYAKNVVPGSVKYRVLAQEKKGDDWNVVALDASDNATDLLIDYRAFAMVRARRLKLEILSAPAGMNLGVLEFTAFGRSPPP